MKNTMPFGFLGALLSVWLSAFSVAGALAQGSAGGSIGNDDKSISGSRPDRALQRDKPAARERAPERRREPRERIARGHSAGGTGTQSFDGTWTVVSAGVTCPDRFTETVVVSAGRIVGPNGSATISSSGSVSGSGNYSGIIVTSQGHMAGRTGAGTFHRSDGCSGRWTSSKR
jgi:hypothetical protein